MPSTFNFLLKKGLENRTNLVANVFLVWGGRDPVGVGETPRNSRCLDYFQGKKNSSDASFLQAVGDG